MSIARLVRRLKPAYALYNLFQRRRLAHNLPLYRKLGLGKAYFSPVSSRDFAHLPAVTDAEASAGSAARLRGSEAFAGVSAEGQASLLDFHERGYAVLPGLLTAERVAAINASLDGLIAAGDLRANSVNKYMFAFRQSEVIREAGTGQLRELVSALLGHEATLFQSINFLSGSQQPTHSDSIHMSTYPLGGLVAAWVALEDITLDNGPLHYYPGSHKLPYYLNADYDNEGTRWLTGDKDYKAYESFIQERVAEQELPREVFLAKAGDVFLWHANLLHGGEPHLDKGRTRKSMVFHYFSQGHICYHEISQRPALMG